MAEPFNIVLSGYSDDCHNLQVGTKKYEERYREFVVHVRLGDKTIRATMEYASGGWQCRLTVPGDALVEVDSGA